MLCNKVKECGQYDFYNVISSGDIAQLYSYDSEMYSQPRMLYYTLPSWLHTLFNHIALK